MTKSLDPTPGYHRVHTTERLLKDPCPQTLGVCACLCVCARACMHVHTCRMVCEGGSDDIMDNRIDILGRKDGLLCAGYS